MPDIHRRIGEDAEQETITEAASKRRSPRSWLAVLIAVVIEHFPF